MDAATPTCGETLVVVPSAAAGDADGDGTLFSDFILRCLAGVCLT